MNTDLGICLPVLLPEPMAPTAAGVRKAAEAAARTGFRDTAFWGYHLQSLVDDAGGWEAGMALLDELGLRVRAIEAAFAWPSGDDDAVAAEAQQLADLARRSGATVIAAVCMDPSLPDLDEARRRLAVVVDAAAAAGASVAVEFLPWSGIPDLATAWHLVEPLGPGAGILLDAWHWQRQPGGPSPDVLAAIPGDRIPYLQVCDVAPGQPGDDLMGEAMTARLLPGEGTVDFGELLGLLDRIGADPFVASEAFNPTRLGEAGAEGFAAAMLDAWGRCQ